MQNAVLTPTKRNAKWCKTQSKLMQNAGRGGVCNLKITKNNRLLRTENGLKRCYLTEKKAVLGAVKNRGQATK